MPKTTKVKMTISAEMEVPGDHIGESVDWWLARFRKPVAGDTIVRNGTINGVEIVITKANTNEAQRVVNIHKKIIQSVFNSLFNAELISMRSSINRPNAKVSHGIGLISLAMINMTYSTPESFISFHIMEDGTYRAYNNCRDRDVYTIVNLADPQYDHHMREVMMKHLTYERNYYSPLHNREAMDRTDHIDQMMEILKGGMANA